MYAESLFIVSHKIVLGIAGLFGVGFIIGFHELGHFMFCKIFNVKTPSFSIGFGPRLFTKKIGDTEFSLSAIPVGGYVEIAGAGEVAQGEQAEASSMADDSFAVKPWYQKMLIMLGGIAFNLIFAYTVLSLLFMVGIPESKMLYPENARPVIQTVLKDSPAEKAGIVIGDTIVSVNDQQIGGNGKLLLETLRLFPDQTVTVVVERNQTTELITLPLSSQEIDGKKMGLAGITLETVAMPAYPIIESIGRGIALTNTFIVRTINDFKNIFSRGDLSQMGGPIMVIAGTAQGAQQGFKTFLLFLAIISVSLAVLNLLPLPILDGGQMLFYSIEAAFGKPLPLRIREYIHIACWLGFVILLVYLSAKDIARIAHPYMETIYNFLGLN